MFCTIRHYEGIDDVDTAIKRVSDDLLPAIRDMEGFQDYRLVKCNGDDGDNIVVSFTVFDTEEQAEQANEAVATLIEKSPLAQLVPNDPDILVGEIVIESRR